MNKKITSLVLSATLMATLAVGCTNSSTQTGENKPSNEVAVYQHPEVKTSDEALNLLKEGNQRFVDNKLANIDLSNVQRENLSKGQKPFAVVVTCSDSRVAPELLFDQGLGDLFIIRVAGNVLDKDEIGSIEYAVGHLDTPLVVIMGHESCGAVTAAVDFNKNHEGEHGSINAILEKIQPAVESAKTKNLQEKELVEASIDENIHYVANQLQNSSPIVIDKLKENKVKITKAKYMLSSGKVEWFE